MLIRNILDRINLTLDMEGKNDIQQAIISASSFALWNQCSHVTVDNHFTDIELFKQIMKVSLNITVLLISNNL